MAKKLSRFCKKWFMFERAMPIISKDLKKQKLYENLIKKYDAIFKKLAKY